MLKLFRDYVFHQVTEDGRPWLDMAHILQCLNKLDAGVPEKVNILFLLTIFANNRRFKSSKNEDEVNGGVGKINLPCTLFKVNNSKN